MVSGGLPAVPALTSTLSLTTTALAAHLIPLLQGGIWYLGSQWGNRTGQHPYCPGQMVTAGKS